MRIAVTGKTGQVTTALAALGPAQGVEIVRVGRPELDLASPATVLPALAAARADAIISAAAYTAVDQAEDDEAAAFAVNAEGARLVAESGKALGLPVLHLSTDYVFDGQLQRAYREDDAPRPTTVYGASKRAGEVAVLAAGGSVFRTAWVYSPFGRNFVKTMAALAARQGEVRVVADQIGCPTSAADIADALIEIARRQVAARGDNSLSGVFHLAGGDSASWYVFAQGVFDAIAARGGPVCRAVPITTADYPTRAARPPNSRLDGGKLKAIYGLDLPGWRAALPPVVAQLS